MRLMICLLIAFLCLPDILPAQEDSALPPLFTADEISEDPEEFANVREVRVRMRVANVSTINISSGDKTYVQYRLHPVYQLHDVPKHSFHIALSQEVEADLRRLGINDLKKHFEGATIEVSGWSGRIGLHLIGSPSRWFYQLSVRSLDDIRGVFRELKKPESSTETD